MKTTVSSKGQIVLPMEQARPRRLHAAADLETELAAPEDVIVKKLQY